MNINKKSKELSYILRHNPSHANTQADDFGWIDVEPILAKLNISYEELKSIVNEDSKNRYELDKTKIRARQGHSFKVNLELEQPKELPKYLYHGTSLRNLNSILKQGLLSMNRQYVHLSENINTAREVGERHSNEVVILKIKTKELLDFVKIYKSTNNVYLVECVPPCIVDIC